MPTLLVMRHAKSSWSPGRADHERPLNSRGRRQAAAAGEWVRAHYPTIDRILCSTAQRTRETLEVMGAGVGAGAVTLHDEIYESTTDEVLRLLRRQLCDENTVLLIGHSPCVDMLVEGLVIDADHPDMQRLRDKFVTSAVAVLEFDGSWPDLSAARLAAFEAPGRRGTDASSI